MGDFAKGIKAFKSGMKEEDETAAATPHQQVPPPAGTASAAAASNSGAYSGSRDQHVWSSATSAVGPRDWPRGLEECGWPLPRGFRRTGPLGCGRSPTA